MNTQWEPVIGLEVHAQLKTDSKLFCPCSAAYGAPPNTNICPICTGQPGVLPKPNRKAIELVIMTGRAFNCRIASYARFARKQYFYPDLPKNYQISQYEAPLCTGGAVVIERDNGGRESIGLNRIHLEEDAGKLLHEIGSRVIDGSLVDLNRTGVPLMEIVSAPEIHSPDQAYAYLVALKDVLEYLGVSDCNMEEGKLRCDANISLRPKGTAELGTKTELKNMNSFKYIRAGLEYEISRQHDLLNRGGRVIQETRLWNPGHNESEPMRTKEESHDYRYFPEPDLVPMIFTEHDLAALQSRLPELPLERRDRFISHYGLPAYDAGVLTKDRSLADYFEQALISANAIADANNDRSVLAKRVSNWITTELLGRLNAAHTTIQESPVTAENIGILVGR
ncbi:MAG: Asp-tRNA(Asn)/Glu-tRNA(Gln) amidotransferase subunit GatB, partial [Elusimicrobia bacterium]|nr:Asp-tRNA(Asn)/Glu-tRNA(Gln) amidotransferase subunit GatB [Elusimicrobiota bacterium]MBD3412391.1 Asp-tRNA(Asn)/Glu-tRNA(Gln) amidotransferase subunit GatB [Elusimicrobiota bacterium]